MESGFIYIWSVDIVAAHPLHDLIGNILWNDEFLNENGYEVERDSACGGDHNVSMFCSPIIRSDVHFSDADLLITKGNKIRVIMEIEESNINPVHIMGKFLGNALSPYHFYVNGTKNISCTQDSTLFIQVCDTKDIKPGSVKKKQFDQIEVSIKKMIPNDKMKIIEYRMIYGTQNDFDGSQGVALKTIIKEFLSK
jgi:hypothetical protein